MSVEDRRDPRLDVPTSLAIAMLAYAAANVVHECLGHGLACRLLGGRFTGFGTSFSGCYNAFSVGGDAGFRAAGTLATMIAGALTALGLRVRPPRSSHLRYFGWFFAALALVQGAAYVVVDSLVGLADWAFVGVHGGPVAQSACVLAGIIILAGAGWVLAPVIEPYLASQRSTRRLVVLVVLPWLLIGGALMTAAALRSPVSDRAYLIVSSAYFNLGCGALLPAWTLAARASAGATSEPLGLARRPLWILTAAAGTILILSVLGPGLTW